MRFSLRDKTVEICFSLQVVDSIQCGFPGSRYKKKYFRAVGYSRRAVCCKTKWPQRVPPASHAIDLALTMRPRANGRHGTSRRSGPRAPRDNGLASSRQPRAKPSCPTGTHPRGVCEIVQIRPRCVRRRSTRGYTPKPTLHDFARSPMVRTGRRTHAGPVCRAPETHPRCVAKTRPQCQEVAGVLRKMRENPGCETCPIDSIKHKRS